jgi:hypothetical protein
MQAEAACEQLRAHGIKCGTVEGKGPQGVWWSMYVGNPVGLGHNNAWVVIVAPEDAERATEVLRNWT